MGKSSKSNNNGLAKQLKQSGQPYVLSNETEGERIIASTSGNLPPDQVAAPGTTLAKRGRHPKNSKNKKNQSCIKIVFENKESFQQLLEENFTWTEEENETPSKFQSHEELRPKMTLEEKNNEKERTIQVFDIPLYVKKPVIQCSFDK